MVETKKKYILGPIQQLIDLNGDSTNFDLTFTVTSPDNSEFDLLVVDQTTLDNTPTLDYKKVTGTMSGNIVADKNMYQNYFLNLKSQNPCEVEVTIEKKNLPETPMGPPSVFGQNQPPPQEPPVTQQETLCSSINWTYVGIAVGVVMGLMVFYYVTTKSNTKSVEVKVPAPEMSYGCSKSGSERSNSGSDRSGSGSRSRSHGSGSYRSSSHHDSGKTINLLDRMKKLNIK